jgi:hypothetical protein
VLLPTGNIMLGWSILMMILLIYLATVLPYAVAFNIDFVSVFQASTFDSYSLAHVCGKPQLAASCNAACALSARRSNMQQTAIMHVCSQDPLLLNAPLDAAWCYACRATLQTRCLCWTSPST